METFDELYYTKPYLREFDGKVVSCEAADGGFAIVLDQTAFYPTGGGQPGDRGTLRVGTGDDILVAHVREAVPGIVHALFGYNNVGFHMGERCIEVDFDGVLTLDDVLDVERRANAAIREDVSVEALLPSPAELAAMDYRSKKDHDGQIRVVRIDGVDSCACCGTRLVHRTGGAHQDSAHSHQEEADAPGTSLWAPRA